MAYCPDEENNIQCDPDEKQDLLFIVAGLPAVLFIVSGIKITSGRPFFTGGLSIFTPGSGFRGNPIAVPDAMLSLPWPRPVSRPLVSPLPSSHDARY
ncbi:MAG: hypothetical protein P8019_15685 [Gammaproteobacteria bacterium]